MNKEKNFAMVLDAGTTTMKTFIFDVESEEIVDLIKVTLRKDVAEHGIIVEQSPSELWEIAKDSVNKLLDKYGDKVGAFGLANQRESVVIWDETGKPVTPLIVWEDTRGAAITERLKADGQENLVRSKTGLTLDAYFTAPTITWLVENKILSNQSLSWGNLDSWLLYNLTAEHVHLTDFTNASRTLLFNIVEKKWDQDLIKLFSVPANLKFPQVKNSFGDFGNLSVGKWRIPILAVCGDQQASLFAAGEWKITYGTGGFVAQNIGNNFKLVDGLFTTLTPALIGGAEYALEGKVNNVATRVTPLIGQEPKLGIILKEIALEVDLLLSKFPEYPKVVVADGGVMNNPQIAEFQSQISGIKVTPQKTTDGTALGVLRLIKKAL